MKTPLRVLIMEDSRADAELLVRELKRGGYQPVFERVETPEAMRAALETQTWDIIISDYVMPHFSGPAALKLIQEMDIDIPFIIVTGQVGEETAVETMRAGANDYLLKGNLTRLVPAIQRELGEAEVRRERKRGEVEVPRLAAIVEFSDEAIIGKTLEGIITSWNNSAERLYGYLAEETIGKPISMIIPPDQANEISMILESIKRGQRIDHYETVRVRKDGSRIDVSVTISPIRDRTGQIIGASTITRDITERKRLEEGLRQAHTLLELRVEERTTELAAERQRLVITLRSIGDGVIATDRRGQITVMNKVAEDLTGWREDEATGRPLVEIFHIINEQSRILLESPVETVLRTDEIVGLANNTLLVARDGTERIIADSAAPIRGENSDTIGVVLVFRDVTERKRSEEALRREKEYTEQLIEMANVMIVGLDADGKIRVFNEAAEKTTGYTKDELQDRNWFEVLVPRDRYPYVWEVFNKAMAEGHIARSFENPVLTKSGEERYISWRNSEISEDGKFAGTISFGIDITDLKYAQLQAQHRAAELQSVLDSMIDGVYVSDADGRITIANETGVKMLGLPNLDEMTRPLADFPEQLQLRHPDGGSMTVEELPLTRALAGETVLLDDEIARNPQTGADVNLRVNATPIRDQKNEIIGAVAVARDVTALTELDRLKEQFISTAAHELKTPLTLMKGYAQALLRMGGDLPPARLRALEGIDRGADRINRIVNDLLNISWLQQGTLGLRMEKTNLFDLASRVVDQMALTATKHRIQIVQAEPVVVSGDMDRLEQVLVHLIYNAAKFSPSGGNIDVAVIVQDHEAVVSVRDYGVGIPEDRKSHIFERFYRAHAGTPYDYGGMGVGLYISKEIITRHGGKMWFESGQNRGSTFYFSLPLRGEGNPRIEVKN